MAQPRQFGLCIDGGGVRIVAALAFLMQLEEERRKTVPDFELADAFQCFAGTSAGALVVMGLEITRLQTKHIAELFGSGLWNSVFENPSRIGNALCPKYSGANLRLLLQRCFSGSSFRSVKPVLVTALNLSTGCQEVFDSSETKSPCVMCVDVALATSAAPCLLPSVQVREQWFVDGGVLGTNPCLTLLGHTRARGLSVRILSVGTGQCAAALHGSRSASWGSWQWAQAGLLNVMLDGEHHARVASQIMGADFLRINSPIPESMSALDNTDPLNIAQLVKLGKQWYLDHHEEILDFFGWR